MERQHFARRARDLARPNPQASLQRSNYAEGRPVADRRRILYGPTNTSFSSRWPHRFASVPSNAHKSLLEWAGARPCIGCCRIPISPTARQHFPRRARDLARTNPQASPQGIKHAEVRLVANRRRILYSLAGGSFFSAWPRRLAPDASHAHHSLLK